MQGSVTIEVSPILAPVPIQCPRCSEDTHHCVTQVLPNTASLQFRHLTPSHNLESVIRLVLRIDSADLCTDLPVENTGNK